MFWKSANKLFFPRGLRARLVLGFAVVLLASIVMLSTVFYYQVRKSIDSTARDFLKSEFDILVGLLEREAYGINELSNFLSQKTLLAKGPYPLSYALYDHDRNLIARSESFTADETFLKAAAPRLRDKPAESFMSKMEDDVGSAVFLITGFFVDSVGTSFYLQLGLHGAPITGKFLSSVRQTMLVMVPIVLVVVTGGGYFLTYRLLSPVSDLTKAAKDLSLTDLSRQLPVRGTGDELDELARTFNDVFERLHHAYRRIVQFTADASHELRLPITAIKGEAEVVLERERSIEEHRKTLSNIVEEMDRLSVMTGKLLRLARVDSGADRLEKSNVHIRSLLQKMVEFLDPLCTAKGLKLTLKQDGHDEVCGDQVRLEELFSNLLENAIKYTPEGGRIDVQIRGMERELEVDIRDTGIGIASEEQQKIFERFYRVDKSRARSEGSSGLGLSIAESIALAHQGRITVESAPGQGSCFRVVLPRFSSPI